VFGNNDNDRLAGKLPQPYLWVHLAKTGGASIAETFRNQNTPQKGRGVHLWEVPTTLKTWVGEHYTNHVTCRVCVCVCVCVILLLELVCVCISVFYFSHVSIVVGLQHHVNVDRAKMVFGHLPYGFDRWWPYDHPNRPNATSYGTMVRTPLDRVWSMYWWHHTKGHPLIQRTTFEEWMEQSIFPKNAMTAHLSGAALEAWYNRGFDEYPPLKPELPGKPVTRDHRDRKWDPRSVQWVWFENCVLCAVCLFVCVCVCMCVCVCVCVCV
jgi:hypothetical protein